jgi:hypothetical protein
MKSNIFGTDEPTSTRTVSDKNKSNIFGIGDNNDQNKRQGGGGRRGKLKLINQDNGMRISFALEIKNSHIFYLDPNASRSESAVFCCSCVWLFLKLKTKRKVFLLSPRPIYNLIFLHCVLNTNFFFCVYYLLNDIIIFIYSYMIKIVMHDAFV